MGLYNGAIKFEFSLSSPWELFFSFCSYKTQLFYYGSKEGYSSSAGNKVSGVFFKVLVSKAFPCFAAWQILSWVKARRRSNVVTGTVTTIPQGYLLVLRVGLRRID